MTYTITLSEEQLIMLGDILKLARPIKDEADPMQPTLFDALPTAPRIHKRVAKHLISRDALSASLGITNKDLIALERKVGVKATYMAEYTDGTSEKGHTAYYTKADADKVKAIKGLLNN